MSYASCVPVMIVITILMAQVNLGTSQAGCNPLMLEPCLHFITDNIAPAPDSECCNDIRGQKACLCGYVKNPAYGSFLRLPGAKKVAQACSVTIPDPNTCT
ncbi:hypothetical protein QVD17_27918 [Tagetes erecta]|uniref:Bifunctional inhibitor/plant lipid transfer protein/seed storage helical domain-containing protein n=1 Tax=Tagetes erecta TaxID=13708 RepID=A0AAD8NS75_TARER|nr:hypothetical protein QVD17_27918 [Tagetes erecta]